ncbi:hypothetical protein HanHA300_Chr16g0615531 [Helianthus annuus]|nr:hypothetical protein HanHA300_Chr16g0615531 [Helianthus annuus]KAJ0460910.1 hypothetical protein HanHA89_Chr16g0666321 [Helianthus annuus]KAJ0641337.1 hypothetical protein HanLR1_Chr16g0626051 [Helianthus annuus]KAJ0645238.1 hypothetical protein HanOQP8_Chr16g0621621 [Helianthus annuus]
MSTAFVNLWNYDFFSIDSCGPQHRIALQQWSILNWFRHYTSFSTQPHIVQQSQSHCCTRLQIGKPTHNSCIKILK